MPSCLRMWAHDCGWSLSAKRVLPPSRRGSHHVDVGSQRGCPALRQRRRRDSNPRAGPHLTRAGRRLQPGHFSEPAIAEREGGQREGGRRPGLFDLDLPQARPGRFPGLKTARMDRPSCRRPGHDDRVRARVRRRAPPGVVAVDVDVDERAQPAALVEEQIADRQPVQRLAQVAASVSNPTTARPREQSG